MKKNKAAPPKDLDGIAHDAKALLAATAEVAEEKVILARNRLSAALEKGKDAWASARHAAGEAAQTAEIGIGKRACTTLGVVFAAGALLGFLLSRRK